jgi:glucose/arabinose dehydrogenase
MKHREIPALRGASTRRLLVLLLACALLAACNAPPPTLTPPPTQPRATPGPPCDNPYGRPRINPAHICLELVLDELEMSGVASVGSLAFDAEGALYVARPAAGAIIALRDEDGDGFMDRPRTFAEGLDTPYGLAFHDGALYATGAGRLYRLRDTDGDGRADERTILVDDLPVGGYWTNSVGVGPDGRLYVSQGASCNACVEGDARRAAIISYALDGSDARVVASGLHNPLDFAWHPVTGELWATESSRFLSEDEPPDELNQIVLGAHYGWPFCYGDGRVDRTVPGATAAFCETTERPALTFPARATPAGMAFYTADAFPEMQGNLIVVTSGSWNRSKASGYELLVVEFGDADEGAPTGVVQRVAPYGPEESWWLSEIDTSFYPEHPVDVAVSAEGWLYVSIQEGQVMRFRPR